MCVAVPFAYILYFCIIVKEKFICKIIFILLFQKILWVFLYATFRLVLIQAKAVAVRKKKPWFVLLCYTSYLKDYAHYLDYLHPRHPNVQSNWQCCSYHSLFSIIPVSLLATCFTCEKGLVKKINLTSHIDHTRKRRCPSKFCWWLAGSAWVAALAFLRQVYTNWNKYLLCFRIGSMLFSLPTSIFSPRMRTYFWFQNFIPVVRSRVIWRLLYKGIKGFHSKALDSFVATEPECCPLNSHHSHLF